VLKHNFVPCPFFKYCKKQILVFKLDKTNRLGTGPTWRRSLVCDLFRQQGLQLISTRKDAHGRDIGAFIQSPDGQPILLFQGN